MGFVSNIVGGILGANAASNASSAEVQGAQTAQNLEQQNQQQAEKFQTGVWTGTQQAEQPYQAVGATGANNLANIINTPFQAPTAAQAEATPGYQFNLEQGTRAIDENAAANGTLMTGQTGTALEQYGQGLASNYYQQAYNNALNTYMTNYGTAMGGAQLGLSSTGQLASAGQAAAGGMTNLALTGGAQQAQQVNNAAAARASGYLGEAAGYGEMAGGIADIPGAVAGGIGNMSSDSNPFENFENFFQGAA